MSKYPYPGTAAREVKAGSSFWHHPSSDFPAWPWLLKLLCYHPESKLFVLLAGVGTRNYYRKIGYELEGPYMVKRLD